MIAVQFHELTGWRNRYRPARRRWIWNPPHVRADADGYRVTAVAGQGWDCTCPDPECAHVDAVAALIAPHILAELDSETAQPPKERTA